MYTLPTTHAVDPTHAIAYFCLIFRKKQEFGQQSDPKSWSAWPPAITIFGFRKIYIIKICQSCDCRHALRRWQGSQQPTANLPASANTILVARALHGVRYAAEDSV
jgi:hypothetical protein